MEHVTKLPPLDPAVAETRLAVRGMLRERPGALVLVALSGGADSLALAAAVAFEAPRADVRAGAVVVDHGLQADSAAVAEAAAAQARALGLDPVLVRRVDVPLDGPDGPEAAAREARYAALEHALAETGAVAILTAHSRDDQAEQVLLALARGSGVRALAGIPPRRGAIRRPFLAVTRRTTVQACDAQGLTPWADPHNSDTAYARVRVRERILPMLVRELGPGVAANLARTADLAREDADALDAMAETAADRLREDGEDGVALAVTGLAELDPAIRHRVLRRIARGAFGTALSREHTLAVVALVTDWQGQGPIHVPGGHVRRIDDRLVFLPADR